MCFENRKDQKRKRPVYFVVNSWTSGQAHKRPGTWEGTQKAALPHNDLQLCKTQALDSTSGLRIIHCKFCCVCKRIFMAHSDAERHRQEFGPTVYSPWKGQGGPTAPPISPVFDSAKNHAHSHSKCSKLEFLLCWGWTDMYHFIGSDPNPGSVPTIPKAKILLPMNTRLLARPTFLSRAPQSKFSLKIDQTLKTDKDGRANINLALKKKILFWIIHKSTRR